ncbi:MAG TPA: SRPBCC domain-containing protein [Thermoanaerobaculia bacterium]|nr:SRPBCC domain-containing protein [Thermoanaerobaculia bacterium]
MSPLAPVEIAITVRGSVDDAFRTFTDGFGSWWPRKTHSVGREKTSVVALENHRGGEIYERTDDGTRHIWGRVVAWEPPHRIVFTWHPGRAEETAQEVEILFRYVGDVTEVRLCHRNWEVLGEDGERVRSSYLSGWQLVLGQSYREAAEGRQEVPR